MAEKRVSVRLAAVGGKQVRAELEGVGDAGVKGFGRMSKEAEIANARLAAFSTRVKIAAAVAVAAAAAAGIAMIRSGLETIDAQANLAQSLGTTTRSIQVLTFAGNLAGVSMDEIAAATKKLTLKLSDAAGGTGTAVAALQRLHLTATDLQALPLDERIVAIQDALTKFVPPAEQAAVASALFGDKAALAFSRIDSATLRQASQDITDFGVAVSDQDADQIRTTGDAIDRLGLVWLGLTNQLAVAVAPALETVANALADATRAGGVFQTSISYLGDHIGEIASIAGAFATFFAGRFVLAMGAAAFGVTGVALSLTALKTALIRTGIGALIVGVGELAYRYDLFSAAADLSSAAQTRMNEALTLYAQIGGPNARAEALASTRAYIAETDAKLASAAAELEILRAKQIVDNAALRQSYQDRGVPEMFTDYMAAPIAAAQAALVALQAELAAARAKLAELETANPAAPLNAALVPANTLAAAIGGAAGQASALSSFLSGLPGDLAGAAVKISGIRASIAALAGGGDAAAASIAKYRAELTAALPPLASMQDGQRQFVQDALEQKVRLFATEQTLAAEEQKRLAVLSAVIPVATATGVALVKAATDPIGPLEAQISGWQAVVASLAEYATNARDIGADVGQTLVGAFQSAEDAVANFVKTGKLSFGDLVTSVLADLAKLAARKFILGPIANALDGVLGQFGGGGLFAGIGEAAVHHAGGLVGGNAPMRAVPVMAFAGAPRMHSGGFAGLRPDEVPAILQKGERVLSRRETASYGAGGPVTVNIQTRDAESFRQSRTQVASDIARAVSLGRRGM